MQGSIRRVERDGYPITNGVLPDFTDYSVELRTLAGQAMSEALRSPDGDYKALVAEFSFHLALMTRADKPEVCKLAEHLGLLNGYNCPRTAHRAYEALMAG